MSELLAGFDWDAGNLVKCQKHGVSVEDIEALFASPLLVIPDTAHSRIEARTRALGKTSAGRTVFSARYMHAKEIASYEKENPQL